MEKLRKIPNHDHQLNRVIGQLTALKRIIETEENCLVVLQQLKASINGLKRFGEDYTKSHIDRCIENDMKEQDIRAHLKQLVDAAFYL